MALAVGCVLWCAASVLVAAGWSVAASIARARTRAKADRS